jgi:acetolactate synthase-1/2/3 large subunit
LAVGAVGNYSRKVANDVASKCDFYIVIGSNLGDHTTKARNAPSPTTKIIHVDIDPRVLGISYKEDVSVVGDARLVLKGMIEAVETSGLSKRPCPWTNWVKEVQSMVASWKEAFLKKSRDGGSEGSINPYFIIATLNKILNQEDVLVADTGYAGAYGNACIEVKALGRKYLRTPGSLGWGFPGALGAQLAIMNKARVICLTGDGGLGYHISDIETAVRYNLPVVVVVMNNSSLGFEYHVQKIIYKDVVPQVNDFLNIDYGAVAKDFGAYGEKIKRPEDVEGALKRALDSGKPAILDFAIDKEVYAPVIYYEPFEVRQV